MDALRASKGFEVQHQRVVLDIDLESQSINASTILTIIPLSPALRTVYLNASPKLDIHYVSLSSPTAVDPYHDTPASFVLSDPFQGGPPFDAREHGAIKRRTWAALDEGDDGEFGISVSGGWIRLVEGEGRFAPIHIRIDYRVTSNGDGVVFDDEQVCPLGGGRSWTPCVDSLWSRCTWELIYIVPNLREGKPLTVASCGELLEQIAHPNTSNKTIFSYLQTSPTTIQHIGFVTSTEEVRAIDDRIIAFGDMADLDFLPKSMQFYSTEFGTYPYQDFKVVFVRDLPKTTAYASLVLLPEELACTTTVIEASIELREVLLLALAQQWVGVNIIPREISDTWIVNGLALHIRSLGLRNLFGNNDYRYRLKKDIDRCVRLDQGSKAPICVPGSTVVDTDFINLKAPLVLHILDRYLAKTGTALGLHRVIPRIFLAALTDELGIGNTLATAYFFRVCRKSTNIDLSQFADQWVFGSRCPHFRIQANFIRKKFLVEMSISQVDTSFEGSLTVRIHEADGAPFEHIVDVKQRKLNLPFNTKYKRTRRSGKLAARFQHLQDQLEADEGEVPVAAEVFAYPSWDNDNVRQDWRVGEWSEDQAGTMIGEGGGYEWIRLDPDLEWLAWFDFLERPWYWVSQLQGDRDVAAQVQAVQSLAAHLSPVVASELARVVLVRNYFYRVRMEAARVLAQFNCVEADHMGSFLLLKLYRHFRKVFNDFSDMSDYFVMKAINCALGDLRHTDAKMALLESLQLNDNSRNPFDDSYHLATIISALGNCLGEHLRRETNDIIDRLLTMDRLVPSYRNLVTQAGLTTLLKAILGGQRTNDPRLFLSYTREGSLPAVRRLAFDCLLLCRPPGRSENITQYMFAAIRLESQLDMREHMARAISESILVSLAQGEIFFEIPEDEQGMMKNVRKELSKRPGLKEGIDAALLSVQTRLAIIKVAEISLRNVPEVLQRDTAPKIRLNLTADIPMPVKAPKIVVKKAIKAQQQGLSNSDLLAIRNALAKLDRNKNSVWFRRPVDPIRDGVPDYPTIIKSPMDLSTVAAKLENGIYRSRSDFVSDIRLIIANCTLYNASGSDIYNAARRFEAAFDNLWAKSESTLSNTPHMDQVSTAVPSASVGMVSPTPSRTPAPPAPAFPPSQPKIKISVPRPAGIDDTPRESPIIKIKPSVAPMAPPPVPVKKQMERRSSAVDDLLGAELDAMERPEPKRPKIVIPKANPAPVPPDPPAAAPTIATVPPPHTAKPLAKNQPPRAEEKRESKASDLPFRSRRAKALLAVLKADPYAGIFSRPVDPILDGCPTYLDEIKEPMDLGTISIKIEKYKTMGQFQHDIELIFANCRQFNPPGDITAAADHLEAVYRKELPRLLSPKMTADEKKAMTALVNRSLKEKLSVVFRTAVDPVALNIPQYFEIIPPEEARDLSMIRHHLDQGKYTTARQVDDDINLMLDNARVFNGADSEIGRIANEFGRWWKAQRQKLDA